MPRSTPKSPSSLSPTQQFQKIFYREFNADDIQRIGEKNISAIITRQFAKTESLDKNNPYVFVGTPDVKTHGYHSSATIIEIICRDMAFIVDSVTSYLVSSKLSIETITHPLIYISRNKKNGIDKVSNESFDGSDAISFVYIELARRLTPSQCKDIVKDLKQIIEDVDLATANWRQMKAGLKTLTPSLAHAPNSKSEEHGEHISFIDYIHDDNFTLLGSCHYNVNNKTLKRNSKTGLGLLSSKRSSSFLNGEEAAIISHKDLLTAKNPIIVTKLALVSPVHRCVPVDVILIKSYDEKSIVNGVTLLIGLFTSVTYSRSLRGIPWLRFKAAKILERAGFDPNNHDGRALRHIIEKFPRDEFLQMSANDLYPTCLNILKLQEKPRIALFLREDTFGRTVSGLVYVPRDRFDTRLRQKFQTVLEHHLQAKCTNFYSTVDDSHLVRIIFVLEWPHGQHQKYTSAVIEKELQAVGRNWTERLTEALNDRHHDPEITAKQVERYGTAFPLSYQETYEARQATHDILQIDHVLNTNNMAVDLFQPNRVQAHQLCLKIFVKQNPIALSDILPILENMGLKVIAEYPYEIKPNGSDHAVWIQDVLLEHPTSSSALGISDIKTAFENIFLSITDGHFENDSLNKLVTYAGLSPRQIVIIRSFVRYLRQTNLPYSLNYLEQALTDHPILCRMACDYFDTKFNPTLTKDREKNCTLTLKNFYAALEKVKSLDQDRILRALIGAMESSLRTNAYQTLKDGTSKDYVSIKFDSSRLPNLPDPRPYREIFVYAPRVEGVHLRGDHIARGGLRWSDRHEDFRTEVLGLMKAQMVKNAVIIPMGAKGGFIVKKLPPIATRDAIQKEGIICYQTFIRGLLDITDNQRMGKIIPPLNVVRHDGDDPYLVVAADKGTATFSDIANALSVEYGFWMGDAFASGGSAGYDHKKMAITARGTWESVKRHFRELNHDTQSQDFTVIGVGDMAGDVFGNGMLQSEHIRLIAAFNHQHIFCDPTPDSKKSFVERKRLFESVKGWDSYNEKCLSKGGRIYNRSDKVLKLTPEIQKCFDIKEQTISPPDFIRILLRHSVDLMFFGGIGTFVKASSETHADAADRGNDLLRINASELRAKVIGEGANMAITQRARIEYALAGGRLNTDFIDNSAGVDTSDHEVNIKILLSSVAQDKKQKLDINSRNKLLVKMTSDVASLVLRDNYQQTQALSLMELQATETLDHHAQFLSALERDGKLNREIEFLPNDDDIARRRQLGKGLTRPELSLLLSYSKIVLTGALLKTTLPDDPAMMDWAVTYFPKDLQTKYTSFINHHQLKREIIATSIANSLINRMGPTYLQLTMEKTGRDSAAIVTAFMTVRDVFSLRPLWDKIESLDNKVPAIVQLKALKKISRLAERETNWFLTKLGRSTDRARDGQIFKDGIESLKISMPKLLPQKTLMIMKEQQKIWIDEGVPSDLAWQIALFKVIGSGPDIIAISQAMKKDVIQTAKVYFAIGEQFHCEWLRSQAKHLHSHDAWTRAANTQILDQLYAVQADLTMSVLGSKNADLWEKSRMERIAVCKRSLNDMLASGTADLAMLTVAAQSLREVI